MSILIQWHGGAVKLQDSNNLTIEQIAADKELAVQVQSILINIKLLSGSADGKFGPRSIGALAELLQVTKNDLTPQLLLETKFLPQPKLDLSKGDFASRIAKYMVAQNYWIDDRYPNIVYVEGCNLDGTLNADAMNEWNDLRLILGIDNGIPKITHSWKATTEPGLKYTLNPLNSGGAFRIAFGQYRAWVVGWHKTHEALVQVGEITGYRDKNKDGLRSGDLVVRGSNYSVNQHWGYDMRQVNGASAGCLVGQSTEGHLEFMKIVKSDPRYKANIGYVFLTTVLPGDKL